MKPTNNQLPKTLLPIASLIETRSNELGVSFSQIVARSGYRNLPKGLRRLNELLNGDVSRAQVMISKLHEILEGILKPLNKHFKQRIE
jgi:hypothetical protein